MSFASISSYIKAHEKLLIVLVASFVIYLGYVKVDNIIANYHQRDLDSKAAALQTQLTLVQGDAANNAKIAAEYKDLAAKTQQANAQLQAANVALVSALAKQRAADAVMPAPELAVRIETLASAPKDSVKPVANGNFDVTNAGAVAIAQALEEFPVFTKRLENLQTEKDNNDRLLAKQTNEVIPGLNKQIVDLNGFIVKADAQCKAEIKVEKDNTAKAKRKYLIIGTVIGAIIRSVVSFK